MSTSDFNVLTKSYSFICKINDQVCPPYILYVKSMTKSVLLIYYMYINNSLLFSRVHSICLFVNIINIVTHVP
jgi:hypothetical protein